MSNNIIKTSEYDAIEPMARVAAATVLSQQLSFCFERKYLSNIEHSDTFKLRKMNTSEVGKKPQWLKIEQIGKPLKDSAEECFTAMQKILSSCFIPNQAQLLFLLNSIGGVSSLYIGIRPIGEEVTNDFSENLNNFICGIWPGLRCYEATETEIGYIQKKIAGEDKKKYRSIVSLTGIPSV